MQRKGKKSDGESCAGKKKSDKIIAQRTREEMQTGKGCSQNDNDSTMLINSYGDVSYAVWFVKMKDCTASFEEAKIFPCKLELESFSRQDSLF